MIRDKDKYNTVNDRNIHFDRLIMVKQLRIAEMERTS